MRIRFSNRGVSILNALLGMAVAGCVHSNGKSPTVRERMASGDNGHASASADAADGNAASSNEPPPGSNVPAPGTPSPIAVVNGVPIDRRAYSEMLLRSHGLPLLQRWMLRDLARQEAKKEGVSISPQDTDREYELMFRESVSGTVDEGTWTPVRRQQFIDEMLRLRGWSVEELDLVMERQALLRKVCEKRVVVEDTVLRKEFAREYGEKVQVRHVQVAALRFWEPLKSRLDAGESFEEVARKYSENLVSRDSGGLLPPFSRDEPGYPAGLVKAAFELGVGEMSNPIQADGAYHVLKLERRIPAQQASFDSVKETLRTTVRDRMIAQEMNNLSAYQFKNARISINEPVLREQYRQRVSRREIDGPLPVEP